MTQISFIKKLKLLLDIILSSKIFMILFLSTIIILIISLIKIKKNKKIVILLYSFIFITSLFFLRYYKFIFNLLDYIIDGIFSIIYFPDFYVYILICIFISFLMNFIILSKKTSILMKRVTIINISCTYFLLFLIFDIIFKNEIDINSKSVIYSNVFLLNFIQLSISIFIIYIIILMFIFILDKSKQRFDNDIEILSIDLDDSNIEVLKIDDIEILDVDDIEILNV